MLVSVLLLPLLQLQLPELLPLLSLLAVPPVLLLPGRASPSPSSLPSSAGTGAGVSPPVAARGRLVFSEGVRVPAGGGACRGSSTSPRGISAAG